MNAITSNARGRGGWAGHLLFLTAWISLIITSGYFRLSAPDWVAGLHDAASILSKIGLNALLFLLVCAGAWICSHATAEQWRLRWKGFAGPIWRGFLWSIALRLAAGLIVVILVVTGTMLHLLDLQSVRALQPQIERVISLEALASDRLFVCLTVVVVSASAGLFEEVWRGGMLAGFAGAFPQVFGGRAGQWAALLPISVLFGLAHLQMGWGAVAGTFLIGLGLGAIILWRQSIWEAVFAHAFFDATSIGAVAWIARHQPHLLGIAG